MKKLTTNQQKVIDYMNRRLDVVKKFDCIEDYADSLNFKYERSKSMYCSNRFNRKEFEIAKNYGCVKLIFNVNTLRALKNRELIVEEVIEGQSYYKLGKEL